MDVGKNGADSFNYIDVARNLSAGEGLVQSAPGFNQPGFWGEKFAPDFPPKTRSAHNVGYPLAIFAVAELTGIDHAGRRSFDWSAFICRGFCAVFRAGASIMGDRRGVFGGIVGDLGER